mmetsp:Transcript_41061/g.64122  ORF Transcript_41061/g.64122 Transcript_41061/m.64122 type:complete len:553 (+) Transcript_41061:49-1707(+)
MMNRTCIGSYRRFVSNPIAKEKAGLEFYFHAVTGFPVIPEEVFDLEVNMWSKGTDLWYACPEQHAERPITTASLTNLGAELHGYKKYRAALACFLRAEKLHTSKEHAAVAKENADWIREKTVGSFTPDVAAIKGFLPGDSALGEDMALDRAVLESQHRAAEDRKSDHKIRKQARQVAEVTKTDINSNHHHHGVENAIPVSLEEVQLIADRSSKTKSQPETQGPLDQGEPGKLDTEPQQGAVEVKLKRVWAQSQYRIGEPDSFCPRNITEDKRNISAMTSYIQADLYRAGRLVEARNCIKMLAKAFKEKQDPLMVAMETLQQQMDSIMKLAAVGRPIFHNLGGEDAKFTIDVKTSHANDTTVQVWDGALEQQQCLEIAELIEQQPLSPCAPARQAVVQGKNPSQCGQLHLHTVADSNRQWTQVAKALISTLVKHILEYEELNPVVKSMKNPLTEEGFLLRKLGQQSSTSPPQYGVDFGEASRRDLPSPGAQHRVVQAVIHFSNKGETRFLNQGTSIQGKCGRVIMFPVSVSHVYAELGATSQSKYYAVNYLNI